MSAPRVTRLSPIRQAVENLRAIEDSLRRYNSNLAERSAEGIARILGAALASIDERLTALEKSNVPLSAAGNERTDLGIGAWAECLSCGASLEVLPPETPEIGYRARCADPMCPRHDAPWRITDEMAKRLNDLAVAEDMAYQAEEEASNE